MKKTIIKSTLYLILISFIAKVLSFIVRIILARSLSSDAMAIYTLANPTLVFVITLAQMGIPAALSKVIASTSNHKKTMRATVLICIVNNLVVTTFYIIMIPFLSNLVFHNTNIRDILYAILPLIPLVTISGLLKGYLLGIQKHIRATSSQLFEEVARIIFLLYMFNSFNNLDARMMAIIATVSISVGELASILAMLFNLKFTKFISSFNLDSLNDEYKNILSVAIPMCTSRVIGSLTYFFEPIIMLIPLSALASTSMISMYSTLNAYVLPILTMPTFVTITLSNYLLPAFTYAYSRGNVKQAKKLFKSIVGCCLFIGVITSIICYQFSEQLLILFYKKNTGAELLKYLAIPFAIYSLQPPLASILHALSQSKRSVTDTLIGSIARLGCVVSLYGMFGVYSLPLALCIGMLVTTLLHCFNIYRAANHF
ncbi:MAG: oligosaccharide flippase family protein [Erysipelotrichaceae bacterium]